MNSLLGLLGGSGESTDNGLAILLQALGAAMRGEDPHAFMKKLANTHPQLKKVNLNDLMGSAEKLAQDNGYDINDVKANVDKQIGAFVGTK